MRAFKFYNKYMFLQKLLKILKQEIKQEQTIDY